ncbi:MAG: hypothetical protein NE330_10810, partial [Lentisphaeraceae bacterium]|nr:hypothetical protein [Lentisphaeraceae bacterium]
NILAMMMPPVEIEKMIGVGVYKKTPKLQDKVERGNFNSTRKESVTYVFEQEGEVTLPEVNFYSWDPKSKEVKEHHLEKVSLTIKPNPAYLKSKKSNERIDVETKSVWSWLIVVIISLALFFKRRVFAMKWSDWCYVRSQQEKTFFKAVVAASKKSDLNEFYKCVVLWLNRLQGDGQVNSLKIYIQDFGSIKLHDEYEKMSEKLFKDSCVQFDVKTFTLELEKSRRNFFLVKKTFRDFKRNPFQFPKDI